MFDADRPIQKSEQDRLDRAEFAKYLARCMLDHKDMESLVIGLYGGSGSGKTSLINLTLEELRLAASNMLDEEKPIVLNFSPWSYSGQNQLIYSFFRRLSSELRRCEYFENSAKIISLLELYVSFFTHQPVPYALRPKHNMIAKLAKPRKTKDEAYGWESGRDLTLVKAELNALLSKQKHKIIIFIDNISRIEDQEINQFFQIVKSMGDYINTIYVLAMDKEHVVRAMDEIHHGEGEQYLEKLVQLPFDVPTISKQDLEFILIDRLQKIVAMVPEIAWQKEYWADIYHSTLKHFFDNSRDITHYINTLSFSFPLVKEVINPVDFFATTAINIFATPVFYGVRDNKDLFTDLADQVAEVTTENLAEDKSRCDEIIQRVMPEKREMVLRLLLLLFPRLRQMYQPDLPYFHSATVARKNLRVCSPDLFDVYFRLAISSGNISDAEMRAVLALGHDKVGFALALLRLNQNDRIPAFLRALDSEHVNLIPLNHIDNIISALIDSADLFPQGENTTLEFDTPMRIHRILQQLLHRLDSPANRLKAMSNAIQDATNSIYIIVHELKVLSEIDEAHAPLVMQNLSLDQLNKLKEFAVNKIKYWADIGRLAEHPKVLEILIAWKEWGDEKECRDFVRKMTMDDRGLISFLLATLKEPIDQTETKHAKNPEWNMALQNINDYISVYMLEPHAKMLFEDASFENLREREQLAILIFLDLIKAKTMKMIPKTTANDR